MKFVSVAEIAHSLCNPNIVMPQNKLVCLFACLLFIAPICIGCGDGEGGNAIVQGTVTIDGQLAESGSVVFHPTSDGTAAYGTIRSDGTYALRVGRGNTNNVNASKIQAGDYVATVQVHGPSIANEEFPGAPPKTGPLLIAEMYTKKATSGLAHEVKAGRNVVNLELNSPSDEELVARAEAAAAKANEAKTDGSEPENEQPSAEGQPADEEPVDEQSKDESGEEPTS